jgi:hypothetical protein
MDKKKKPAKKDDQAPKAAPKPEEPIVKEEKPFDFGGFPQRDLKKNLGCG